MTGSDRHNNGNKSDADRVVEQFPAGEQNYIRKIWQKSRLAKPVQQEIAQDEVESRLAEVHRRLNFDPSLPSKENEAALTSRQLDWRWVAAAAASVLLIFAAGIFFVPKKVTVPYAETQTVDLPDGSQVKLNSGSELRYGRLFSLFSREVELNGEAFFTVENGELPFKVRANGATVRVTGTRFNIRSWKEDPGTETEVTVSEGTILFYPGNLEERSVTVPAGRFSRWSKTLEEPTDPDSASLDRVTGWRNRIFAFNNKPLIVILKELERRFDITIALEASDYTGESVTIYYVDPKNVEVILKDICRVKGLRYSASANGYRIYQ